MSNNRLYSLSDVLTNGIVDESGKQINISKIIIPKIQRSYAQGRKDEGKIRSDFVGDIFRHLINNDVMELGFVYGSLSDDGELSLLDGQQRLTTLFLFYWYIAKRENIQLPAFLSKFVYETRHTSTEFLRHILNDDIIIDGREKPSISIARNKWFVVTYEEDPTIDSMLRMLDYIDESYNMLNCHDLYEQLQQIVFYVLVLEKFGLTDELYIKMNARGLTLVPFENFKADLIKQVNAFNNYMGNYELDGKSLSFKQYFPIVLDSKYVHLYWTLGSTDDRYDRKYFRFFYRYMAAWLTIHSEKSASDLTYKDDDFTFFDINSEIDQQDRYLGFMAYQKHLNPEVLENINHVLELLYENYSGFKPYIKAAWGDDWDLFEATDESRGNFSRPKRTAFAAIMDYLHATKEFDLSNFKHWMRIVWNIIENSNIDGAIPQINTIRTLHNLIEQGAAKNTYSCLASLQAEEVASGALREEIDKAKAIVDEPEVDWEENFIIAENHPFFKGMIRFFYQKGMTLKQFKHRYAIVKDLFDNKGITTMFRKDHLLIRAMFSQLNSWQDLNELSFTEKTEAGNFLKLMLASKQKLWTFFSVLTDNANNLDDVKILLKKECTGVKPIVGTSGEDGERLQRAYNRLVHDENLFNWISETENQPGRWFFRVYFTGGHYFVAVPRKWYARMIIDTDRQYIIPLLAHSLNMKYSDDNEKRMLEQYHDFFGNDVALTAIGEKGHILWVNFGLEHIVKYSVKLKDNENFTEVQQALKRHFEIADTMPDENNWLEIKFNGDPREDGFYYDSISTYSIIEKTVKELLSII